MMRTASRLARAGFDAIAIKPAERPPESVDVGAVDAVVVDFEGLEHQPTPAQIRALGAETPVMLTAPVRVDGFDPLGDDHHFAAYEDHARFALVAGNGAYLDGRERRRAIAPRLAAALERYPDAWVGTEGIERLALATGATQYELLSPRTHATVAGLRAAGYDGDVAVYAPTVVTDDRSAALDALDGYLRRRGPVRRALDNGVTSTHEETRVLLAAMDGYALVGDVGTLTERIDALRRAGATTVVGYPAARGESGHVSGR